MVPASSFKLQHSTLNIQHRKTQYFFFLFLHKMTVLNGNRGKSTNSGILLLLIINFFTIGAVAGIGIDFLKAKRNEDSTYLGRWNWNKNFLLDFFSQAGILPSTDSTDYLYYSIQETIKFDNDFIRGNISILNGTVINLSELANNMEISTDSLSERVTVKVAVARLGLTARYKAGGFISLQIIGDAAKNIENTDREIPVEKSDKSALKSSSILQSSSLNSNSNSNSSTNSSFHGNGDVVALVTGLSFEVTFQLFTNSTNGRVGFAYLGADISFDSVQGNATNMQIDDSPVDWNEVSRELKPNFDRIWRNKKHEILSYILERLNEDAMQNDVLGSVLLPVHFNPY